MDHLLDQQVVIVDLACTERELVRNKQKHTVVLLSSSISPSTREEKSIFSHFLLMASCHETESESLYVWGPTYDVVNLGPVSLSFSFLDAIGRQLLQREMALVVIKIIRTRRKKKKRRR